MTICDESPLVLGSISPRRRQILTELRVPLRVVEVDVNEDPQDGEAPADYLDRIVLAKLRDAAGRIGGVRASALLVADTTVVIDARMLGKPRDVEEARELVARLVGRTHQVLTRYAIAIGNDWARPLVARTVESSVTMRAATAEEVERYAATGEGLDKAGAYAVQGLGAFLVERIDGSYTNVMGLPACEVIVDLRNARLLEAYP